MAMMSVRRTAQYLGVHENTIRNWESRGILRAVRLPGSGYRRFPEEQVYSLVEKMRGDLAPYHRDPEVVEGTRIGTGGYDPILDDQDQSVRLYEQFPRPTGPYYEIRFRYLSQGDIFEDVPFGTLGPELRYISNPLEVLHSIVPARGIIVSPTCDFRRPSADELDQNPRLEAYTLQPFVIMAPVLPLASLAETWGEKRVANLGLLQKYDALRRYMYLPRLPEENPGDEWVVDLTAPDRIALGLLLRQPSARLAQLTFDAAQQLHYKVVLAATSRFVDRTLFEPPMN